LPLPLLLVNPLIPSLLPTTTLQLEFAAPEDPGEYKLTLNIMSDSYIGCDQEFAISLTVIAGDSTMEED